VARLGNFTRAAEAMHVTQAGLSIMMRELEAQLQCRLFDRTTRIVSLTPAGERFLPVAGRVASDLEAAAEQLGALAEQARHTLRVGVTPLVSSNILPAASAAFRRIHPQVKLQVVDTDPYQVQAMVERGEIDFGLGAFFKATAGVELAPLFEYQLIWIAPPRRHGDAPDLSAGRLPWTALAKAPLVGLPPENRIQQVIESHLEGIGRAHEERPIFNNFETLIAMVGAGAGSAVVPSYAIAACRRHGVQTALLAEPEAALNFYRITRRGREPASMMADFVEAFVASVPRLSRPPAARGRRKHNK